MGKSGFVEDCLRTTQNMAGTPEDRRERQIFIDNLLVRVHLIIEMSRPALRHGSFEFPFSGSLISTFQVVQVDLAGGRDTHNAY